MGVAQVARGTGVVDDVMRRAVKAGGRVSAKMLALSVDQRNTPAGRLSRRWDLIEFAIRGVWIVTLPPIEGWARRRAAGWSRSPSPRALQTKTLQTDSRSRLSGEKRFF